jgi:endonuclease/exonuclease/phosphatase family metal-dependent hydrolase
MTRPSILLLALLLASPVYAQQPDTLRVATYNLLKFGTGDSLRALDVGTILRTIGPDLVVCEEVSGPTGYELLRDVVLPAMRPGFTAAPFHDGPDTDIGLLYDSTAVALIGTEAIPSTPRNMMMFTVLPIGTDDTLRIFAAHLKAGDTKDDEAARGDEAGTIRERLLEFDGANCIVLGDFNLYSSDEPAYLALTGGGPELGPVIDPTDRPGTWHNDQSFALMHTQSTRLRAFGGGVSGGMDDRFDFILISPSLRGNYLHGSYTAFGNDGQHFNDSINAAPNNVVPMSLAQALHDASDHIPVYLDMIFERSRSSAVEDHPRKIPTLFRLW